jgi:hypothetical protein
VCDRWAVDPRVEDERLLELIRELHRHDYFAYGSWRMWKALLRAGEQVTDLILDARRMALAQHGAGADVALVHQSDAGSQYISFDYTQTLDYDGVLGGLSRTTPPPWRVMIHLD